MDFLDPKNERRARTKLLLGYCLIALAIGIATLILLYWSYGYNVDRQGEVTQNGLVFVSSQPDRASIYLNGQLYKSSTNTRVVVPAGKYALKVASTGYRDWERPVFVAGGDVQHFDYPLLFPQTLQTASVAEFAANPSMATQSPDGRWLVIGRADVAGTFTLYDLKDPAKPVVSDAVLPAGSVAVATGTQNWTAVEWSSDSRHVLLQHTYVQGQNTRREYILLDRDTPTASVNLTNTLNLSQTETVALFNSRVDQFYVYDSGDQTLKRENAGNATVASQLEHILAFKASGDNEILYVTDQSPTGKATPGLVSAVLQHGQQTVTLRTLPPAGAGSYVLNLAQYSDDWYVAVASTTDSAAYIYKNPQSETTPSPDAYPAPWRRIQLSGTSYIAFAPGRQFLLAESGQNFVVYDLENVAQYRYATTQPIDSPQPHAVWMDADRIAYVSGGKLEVFDYDYHNQQSLMPADPAYSAFIASDASYLYALRPADAVGGKPALTSTPLTVKP